MPCSIVFSCWTHTLDLIGKYLRSVGVDFERIDGTTSQPKRQDILDRFDGTTNVRVLIMTTGTGAFGSVPASSLHRLNRADVI